MVDHTKRMLLSAFGAVSLVLGVLGVATALLFPAKVTPDALVVSRPVQIPSKASKKTTKLSEQQFKYVWNKRLQGPLEDPKPKNVKEAMRQPDPKPAPARRIEAVLVGTLVDDDPRQSRAWIEVKGQRQAYAISDTIENHPGKPTIKEVTDHAVTIRLGGSDHTLSLKQNSVLMGDVPGAAGEN